VDKQRLPLESVNAKVVFVNGQWTIESLQATGAGGRIEAQGKVTGVSSNATKASNAAASANWQGSATVHGINPAALHSRLAATTLDGQLKAQQTPSGIAFDARLQPAARKTTAPRAGTLDGLRLKAIQAQGLWQAPMLKLDTLTVQTDDAQLQGQLTFDTVSQGADGRLALTLPGAQAELAGQIASSRGQGEMRLRVTDAALASRWLQRWPGMPMPVGRASIQGSAEFTGRWQGGWHKQGQELQIQASLRAPRLDLRGTDQPVEQAWRLRDLQADLSGTLRALSLTARGQAEHATQRFALQAQARGGRVNDGVWQASVDTAQFTAQDSLRPGVWTLQSSERVVLD